jgi:endo-1,4-beta-xylanase
MRSFLFVVFLFLTLLIGIIFLEVTNPSQIYADYSLTKPSQIMFSELPMLFQAPNNIRLYGYVNDLAGSPIGGAYIDLRDANGNPLANKVTVGDGYYEFIMPLLDMYQIGVTVGADNGGYTLLKYIPAQLQILPGGGTEVRTDIVLQPCSNLILMAYGIDGNLLRNTSIRATTNDQVYVTDSTDLPNDGIFWAVHDDYSKTNGFNWDLAVPAFMVPLQSTSRLHVLWEVANFGKVILDVDNEGQGYTATEQGGYRVLNFNYEAAKSELAALRHDYDTFIAAGYSISPTVFSEIQSSENHLHTAEEYLAQLQPPMIQAVYELNQSLSIALWAHEELYLEKARADVEQNRKGTVRLRMINEHGQPLAGANIAFQQASHDFLFGVNPMGKDGQYDSRYATLARNAGLNYSYILAGWGVVEPSPGQFDWSGIESYQNIQAQLAQPFGLMGGLALWLYRGSNLGYQFCPQYQDNMTFSELQANASEHMRTLGARYKGRIDLWEINEQNESWANALNLTWDQKVELYRSAIAGLKQGNPGAKVIFCSTALPYEFNTKKLQSTAARAGGIAFPEFLDLVIARGIPVDNIALEFYYSGVNTDGYVPPGLNLVSLSRLLDRYSVFNKPIFVRELSAPSLHYTGSTWWHRPWDQATQAEFLEKFYTIAFSRPLVQEIGWSYGMSDETAYIRGGGLLDASLNPKIAYYKLKDLLTSLTTSGAGQTDADGNFLLQGFAGQYNIIVNTTNGQTWRTQVHVLERQQTEVTVSFHNLYLPILLKLNIN